MRDPDDKRRGVLGFCWGGHEFIGAPQRPFKPHGLAIWGAPPGAKLRQACIGPSLEVLQSTAGVPCKFFALGDSYEQLANLIEAGKEPPAWCDWSVVQPWHQVLILIELDGRALGPGDGIELCMWGILDRGGD